MLVNVTIFVRRLHYQDLRQRKLKLSSGLHHATNAEFSPFVHWELTVWGLTHVNGATLHDCRMVLIISLAMKQQICTTAWCYPVAKMLSYQGKRIWAARISILRQKQQFDCTSVVKWTDIIPHLSWRWPSKTPAGRRGHTSNLAL